MGDEQRRLPHGAVVRLTFPLCELLTTLCHEHPEEFAKCEKCGFIAEFFYKLQCPHYLCASCIRSTGSYTCWKDGTTTTIETPLTTTPTRNAQLIEAAMLCPGCSQPIIFKDIKAHINQQHSGLWKRENQRTKIDEKAYGGHAVKNQGPPANTVYPSGGAEDKPKAAKNFGSSYKAYSGKEQPVPEQRFPEFSPISEFSKSPGMSFVTPTDITGRSRAPLRAGYGSDAGTAGLGGYPQTHKEDDLQRYSPVQQAPRLDESAAISELAEEDMELTESCPQSPIGATIAGSEQRMADISNSSACRYCSKTFHVEKIQPQERETVNHDLHQKQIEQLHEEIRHLKEEKTAQEEKLNTASNRCSTLEQLVEKLRSDLKDIQTTIRELHLSEERNRRTIAKCEENLNNANNERSKLEDRLEKQRSECHEASSCARRLKTELNNDALLPVFQHTWKLQPYSALRKSLLFNNARLSTGVLSVNTPGYKIELMLSIRGDYREWRRQLLKDENNVSAPTPHLALMLRIHQGEHDDLLAWPFTNKISLLLVNHLNEEKSKLLELGPGDGDGDWLKKPVRASLNPMFGFSRVISLPDLENLDEGFLFQDCIVFKFTVHRRE